MVRGSHMPYALLQDWKHLFTCSFFSPSNYSSPNEALSIARILLRFVPDVLNEQHHVVASAIHLIIMPDHVLYSHN